MKQMWLLTAVLMVGVLAGGYFLLVSPKKGQVTKLQASTTTQRSQNTDLQGQIAMLEQQAKSLPAKQRRLAAIETKIPNNPSLPALVRSLTKSGRQTGMKLQILEPQEPAFVDAAAATSPPPPPPPAPGTSGATGTAGAAATTTVDVGMLALVPIKVTACGSFAETQEFLSELESHKRTLMVTGAEIGFTPPANDNDKFCPGELTVVLDARVYMRSLASAAAQPKPAKSKASASETNE
jgi:Tfp pilus assembly protein PilO